MAKSWSGFKPQNEVVLLQWAAMTITDPDVARNIARQLKIDVQDNSPDSAEDFGFDSDEIPT
jgi:hypothetical protein